MVFPCAPAKRKGAGARNGFLGTSNHFGFMISPWLMFAQVPLLRGVTLFLGLAAGAMLRISV
jgi:hypothetical protein